MNIAAICGIDLCVLAHGQFGLSFEMIVFKNLCIAPVGASIARPRVSQFPEVNENTDFNNSIHPTALQDLRNGRAMLAPTENSAPI